ncbi:MAG: CYTH domain-containing protein [Ignavibacteria bacterium]
MIKNKWEAIEKSNRCFIKQGYILTDSHKTIRIRQTDSKSYITIKGSNVGAIRPEYEYEIPSEDAEELIEKFAVSSITKIRYIIDYKNKKWEVDEFLGDNEGLIIAEIELKDENEEFELPEWIGKKSQTLKNITIQDCLKFHLKNGDIVKFE